MSVVIDLQKHIIENKKSITEILREALFIASKLKLNDFRDWINSELKGYDNNNVPTYRILRSELRFFNPYHGWRPSTIVDTKIDNLINTQKIQQSISELENLVSNSDELELTISIDGRHKKAIMGIFNIDLEPASFVGKTQIVGIIEQVKTTLLEWSIRLEEEGIVGDKDMGFSTDETKKAQKSIHIQNFNGVMGDVENLGNVSAGDHNKNITTINNSMKEKIDELIEQINTLSIYDKNEIIDKINASRDNKEKLMVTLGQLMTRGAEISTIIPAIVSLLGLLS